MTRSLLLVGVLLAAALSAAAQNIYTPGGSGFNPYYPYPPYNPYPVNYGRYGGTLIGGAQFLQSQGNVLVQQEQARVTREQAEQEKIKTRKMAFDQAAYEKANTPTWTEDQEKVEAMRLRRMMEMPNKEEVVRGDTLNTMLPTLKSMSDHGVQGPPQYLNPATLREVNVTAAGTGRGVGVLRAGGKVFWPIALRGKTQQELDRLLPEAVARTVDGSLDAKLLGQIRKGLATLKADLSKSYQTEQIDSAAYLADKHFLEDLDASVQALGRPDAANYFNGTYTARGNNVPELVNYMTANGLKFAPASPGHDAAYAALHSAFVAYARAAQGSTGFQARLSPAARVGGRSQ